MAETMLIAFRLLSLLEVDESDDDLRELLFLRIRLAIVPPLPLVLGLPAPDLLPDEKLNPRPGFEIKDEVDPFRL